MWRVLKRLAFLYVWQITINPMLTEHYLLALEITDTHAFSLLLINIHLEEAANFLCTTVFKF